LFKKFREAFLPLGRKKRKMFDEHPSTYSTPRKKKIKIRKKYSYDRIYDVT